MFKTSTNNTLVHVYHWVDARLQAKKREQMLEQAVSEAQTSESRVTTLQHWISRVDNMLKEHEENDTTMDDLPHDFQVVF